MLAEKSKLEKLAEFLEFLDLDFAEISLPV